MDETTDQPRIPGVRYRRLTRHRKETTVIDGVPSTRTVRYAAWEPVPPREWDELIMRGVTALAIGITLIAVVATTASVGGLLSAMVPAAIAYGVSVVFTCTWLAALGLEWVDRVSPDRAKPARVAGWLALLISMAAVFSYGRTLHQPYAGGFGACIDLLAKGLWALLIRHYAVPLDEGVAHWVTDREQELAGRALLAARLRRLNRRAAYQQAVGGAESRAAEAILASAEGTRALTGADTSGQAPETSGQAPDTGAEPAAPPAPPVPPAQQGTAGPLPVGVAPINQPSIASIIRDCLAQDPKTSDADLIAAVRTYHPDRPNLADTVRRTAARIDPKRKAS